MLKLTNLFTVSFLIFFVFVQENTQTCIATSNCLNLKLKSSEKLYILVFYQTWHDDDLLYVVCNVQSKYKDRLDVKFRVGPLAKKKGDGWTCPNDESCESNLYDLCRHKIANGAFDNCGSAKLDYMQTAECFCKRESENLLQKSAEEWASLQLSEDKLPTLTLNGKWDPCLDVSSPEAFARYVKNIYK